MTEWPPALPMAVTWDWLVETLRVYPELSLFPALAIGFWLGPKKLAGFSLGSVTATLLAAIAIGQLGIQIPGPIKSTFFLLFLFAVGYGVGPQFFSGLSKEGPRQIAFSLIVLALCLIVPYLCAVFAGLDVGYAVGLYAGSQTTRASIGVATDQIQRGGLDAARVDAYVGAIPIGYAVTYIFGTIGSAIVLAAFPRNTIGVYSFSKYFGCTGWRLGVIALHEQNLFDALIAKHPEKIRKQLDARYATLSLEPRKIRFIDRIVADSRDVALNHTAGLSLPQQVMMALFSLSELMDEKKYYQKACIGIVRQRARATVEGLGIEVEPNPLFDYYYGLIDLEFWMRKYLGEDIVTWIKKNVHPLDIAFKLAQDHGIVLLNGSGFDAPNWSVRVSFANLEDHVYDDIGRAVRAVACGYREAFEASEASPRARKPRKPVRRRKSK